MADKSVMRGVLAEAGVDDNAAAVVTDRSDVVKLAEQVGYPLICKPIRGIRSRGITRVDGPEGIDRALDWGRAAVGPLESPELLVEQFRHGREFSVETISEAGEHLVLGVTSTRHLRREADHYIEIAHGVPAPVASADRDRIVTRVTSALDALGVRTGVTHTEVIVNPDDVHILETHIRPGGDQIPDLWALVSGIDLVDETVRQSLGEPVLHDVRARLGGAGRPPCAAIWYACPTAVGEITHVDGVDDARAATGVVTVEIVLGQGELLVPMVNTACRAAYVCAVGDSHDEALDRARRGVACLSFVVRAQDSGLDQGSE